MVDNESVELRRRVDELEKQVNQLFGQSLGLAACVAVSQPVKFDLETAKALLPRLAGRKSSADIPEDLRSQAELTIRLVLGLEGPPPKFRRIARPRRPAAPDR